MIRYIRHSWALLLAAWATPLAAGEVEVRVVDAATGQPVAARMHLKDERGRPVRPSKTVYWKNHFVFDGTAQLKLPEGTYRFTIERGPEYAAVTGHFQMVRFGDDVKRVALRRIVHMAEEGWYGGDLHVHRPVDDMELLTAAEDLHVAPAITWWRRWERACAASRRAITSCSADRPAGGAAIAAATCPAIATWPCR